MSQAVSAPSTGARSFTGGKSVKATGNSTGFAGPESPSRRAVLAGMMLAPAAIAMAPEALAAVAPRQPEDAIMRSRRIDAEFWEAYNRQKRIHAHWMAAFVKMRGSPLCDVVTGNWCARHSMAETRMMLISVSTLPALYAKLQATKANEMDWDAPLLSGFSPCDHILFDMERMVMREHLS